VRRLLRRASDGVVLIPWHDRLTGNSRLFVLGTIVQACDVAYTNSHHCSDLAARSASA
jgi:hypothetical protein